MKVNELGAALVAEFVGTMLFQLLGGSEISAEYNGVVLAVIIFCMAKASGGVVNPAVATGLYVARELSTTKWLSYVVVELAGAVLGALIAGLIEGKCYMPKDNPELKCFADWSIHNTGPGCVPDQEETRFRVWAWECVGSFMLVSTVYATAIAKPGFGNVAPFAIGAAIFINVGASGIETGGAYNPARFFGPALVFGCRLHLIWLYWSAQVLGGVLAALLHKFVLHTNDEPPPPPPPKKHVPTEHAGRGLAENDSATQVY